MSASPNFNMTSTSSSANANVPSTRFSEASTKSFSPLNQHQYSPFHHVGKASPPVFETVDIDAHFTSSASSKDNKNNNNTRPQTAPAATSETKTKPLSSPSYFVHREVLGEETSKMFEKKKKDSDSDSDDDDENIPPPPPPSDPYPFANEKNTTKPTTASTTSTSSVRPPPPIPAAAADEEEEDEVLIVKTSNGQQQQQQIRISPKAGAATNTKDDHLSTEKERQRFVQTHETTSTTTTFGKKLTDEEMLENDDDGEELDHGEEDYSILHRNTDWKKQNNAKDYHHDEDGDDHIDLDHQPEMREVETMFHQLRLEQRVAGELAGVLRESSATQSYAVKIATEKAKELKRQREALLAKENLQVAREQETSYQQEEVNTQNGKRLNGITDVLERSLESENTHFTGMRDLEDRIIDKQRAAQIKKMELQRLQELAEDCISQLTTFELRNTARERMIQNLESDLEKRLKESKSTEKEIEERLEKVQAREKKISEWVEALETKEKHLTNQDTELQGFADEFLRREENVRAAKKESQMRQHQAQNVSSMAGTRFHHEGSSPPPPPPPHTMRKPPGVSATSTTTESNTTAAPSQRFSTPAQSAVNQNQNQQPQQQTPEALDRDDDDGMSFSPGSGIRV